MLLPLRLGRVPAIEGLSQARPAVCPQPHSWEGFPLGWLGPPPLKPPASPGACGSGRQRRGPLPVTSCPQNTGSSGRRTAPAAFAGPGQCCLSRQEPLGPARRPRLTRLRALPVPGQAPLRRAQGAPARLRHALCLPRLWAAHFFSLVPLRAHSIFQAVRGEAALSLLLPKPGIRRVLRTTAPGSAAGGPYRRAKVRAPAPAPLQRPRPSPAAPPLSAAPPLISLSRLHPTAPPTLALPPTRPRPSPLSPPSLPLFPHFLRLQPLTLRCLPSRLLLLCPSSLGPAPSPDPAPPHPLPPPPSPQVSLPCPLTPQPRPLTPGPAPLPASPGSPPYPPGHPAPPPHSPALFPQALPDPAPSLPLTAPLLTLSLTPPAPPPLPPRPPGPPDPAPCPQPRPSLWPRPTTRPHPDFPSPGPSPLLLHPWGLPVLPRGTRGQALGRALRLTFCL